MNDKQLTIGLFGFGVVGEGIYKVLQETPSLNATIYKICIRHPEKKRNAPAELFTTRYDDLLNNPAINLIVELIDNSEEAFVIVSQALQNGKAVVSANKKMIAEHFSELLLLQQLYKQPLLYEAAVCGSIPIIRNLEEYYDNDLLKSVCGIVNGSTNYILTRMLEDKSGYAEALLSAQQLGFAESNPALDVNGIDAANKLVILLVHAYGLRESPKNLLCKGIVSVNNDDARVAGERGFKIRLIARASRMADGSVAAFVMPHFIGADSQLFNVRNEYNGIVLETGLADKQFLFGKGAGRYPTSSAVLSDIAALRYDYRYEYRKLAARDAKPLSADFHLRVYVSFDDWKIIDRNCFAVIEEFHVTGQRNYLVGIIHYRVLKEAAWFCYKDVSVIAMPGAIIENSELEKMSLKKRSLELAGLSI